MTDNQHNMSSRRYDDLPVQDLRDVLGEFYRYDRIVTKDMSGEEEICTITRLVTIIEQFFRGVMCVAFDNGRVTRPHIKQYANDRIRKKQSELLLPTTDMTKSYLASMSYSFQQIGVIEKEMKNLGISYCDMWDEKYVKELFALRHNITHTVAAYPPHYEDIRKYYAVAETMFHMVLDSLNIPKWSFYRLKGYALMFLEDFKRATECHELALDYLKQFGTADAYAEMASACLDIDSIRYAKRFVARALEIDANNADANYCKGMVLQNEDDPKGADRFFQKVIKTDPNYVEAYIEHAKYLRTTGRVEECAMVLDEAIKHMPSIPEFYFERGIALRESGRLPYASKDSAKGDNLIINFVKLHRNNTSMYDSMMDVLQEYNRRDALRECELME